MRYKFTPSADITVLELAHILQISGSALLEEAFHNLTEEERRHFTPVDDRPPQFAAVLRDAAPQYFVGDSHYVDTDTVGTWTNGEAVTMAMEVLTPDPHSNS